jgi:hypothetical protein
MQNVPKIVLKRLQSPAAAAHPDADLLTSFAEQSLSGRERSDVTDHLARCGDCREVVALALPATESVALTSSARPARIGWLSLPVLRWGVVASAILVVSSVGVLQYRQRHQENTLVSSLTPHDQATETAAQSSPSSKREAVSQPSVPRSLAQQAQTEERKQTEMQAETQSRAQSTSAGKNFTPFAGSIRQSRPINGATLGRSIAGASAVGGIGSGSGAGQGGGFPPGSTQQVVVPRASQTVEVQSETAQVTAQTTAQNQISEQLIQNQKDLPLQGRAVTSLDVVGKAKNPVPAQDSGSASAPALAPPSIPLQAQPSLMLHASPRWSISSAGALQRSFDRGKTWEDVSVSPTPTVKGWLAENVVTNNDQEDADKGRDKGKKNQKGEVRTNPNPVFRAVAATGPEVWAGGSGAMLYHSLDAGARWTRVLPSTAGAALTGDIIAVEFSDLQHVTITTSAPEVWITADAGQTWQKQ